jgi:TolB-like protein/tetratricopeptide (TPR) repeat protein
MPSIIPGYTYDIFVSYRQKDNKHDGWVTEFVDNLKGELESTFKEEISVYFDINPHDGLLETHDVDESLKDKLKCLAFIPIISRTYCDPKSFAWEHEFKAFVEIASNDQFGLKIKLPNGNVASRVIPVRIHDLDPIDIKECEAVLGGVLRGVEFIYKESGIDKPLAPDDDERKNSNNTKYRIQIIKVAHAIKENIQGMHAETVELGGEKIHHGMYSEEEKKDDRKKETAGRTIISPKSRKWLTIAFVSLLCGAGIFAVYKLTSSGKQAENVSKQDKSIAVLPFKNLSNDPEQEYFSDGVVDAILNYLFKIRDLKVTSSTSTKRYKNTNLSMKEIGRELGVSSILEGSVQKIGNNVRITAQLIDAGNDEHLWSEIYTREFSDIFSIQSEVAQNIASELKATLTAVEKAQMRKVATVNTEAFDLYMQGRFFMHKLTRDGIIKSIEYYEKAVSEDPEYALAFAGLAEAYNLLIWGNNPWSTITASEITPEEAYFKSREYAIRALELDKNLAEAHTVLGALLSQRDWNWEQARKEFRLAIDLNPNFVNARIYYAMMLDDLRENHEARKQIDIALKLDPFFSLIHESSGLFYFNEGKYRESVEALNKAQELNPQNYNHWYYLINYLKMGEDLKAVEALGEIFLLSSDTVISKSAAYVKDIYEKSGIIGLLNFQLELVEEREPDNVWGLTTAYARVGKKEEALDWLEKLFENSSGDLFYKGFLPRINNSAEFDNVRSEPRFQALMGKMGLSDYQTPK